MLKKVILPYTLLAIFLVYQANIIVNTHTHYINGILLTHSHPSSGDHTHSNAEVSLLNRLSVFYSLKAGFDTYSSYQQAILYVLEAEQSVTIVADMYWKSTALRAPPYYSI